MLVGRVSSLNTSLCWALIPFGGLAGGATVGAVGLAPALVGFGTAYFLATTLPALLPARDRPAARAVGSRLRHRLTYREQGACPTARGPNTTAAW